MRFGLLNKICFIKIRFLFFLFLAYLPVTGQSNKLRFDRYTANEGLYGRKVNCVYKDRKGFIWAGTTIGLNRFDGISFKSYSVDVNDTTSIPGNDIRAITEDLFGNLWIITTNNFCIYNRKTDSFIQKQLTIDNSRINIQGISCFSDSKGYMWLGTPGEIYRFKTDAGLIKEKFIIAERYLLDETDLINYKNTVSSFIEDKDSKLWVVSNSKYLFQFDDHKKRFFAYTIDHPESNTFSNKTKKMIMDNDGDFIITIGRIGLLVWEKSKNTFDLFKQDKEGKKGPSDNVLSALAIGTDNLIWVGAIDQGGIALFDKKNKTFTAIKHNANDPFSLGINKVHCIYTDKTGNVWVGLNNQLNMYCPYKEKFTRYLGLRDQNQALDFTNTLCFAESKTGEIWIGTDGSGLSRYNPKTGSFTLYKHIDGDPKSLSSNSIISLCEDHEGTLWIGTFNGGLCRFKNNVFTTYLTYKDAESTSFPHVWYVFEDSKNNLWVATLINGLKLFDRKTQVFYTYKNDKNDSSSLSNNSLIQVFEDKKQNIYITSGYGINTFNLNDYDFSRLPPKIKFKKILKNENENSISSNKVRCVAEDDENNLWFGNVVTGLDKYDRKTHKYTNYSTKEGLPGNNIYSIIFDKEHKLWLTTDNGLARFDPPKNEIKLFDKEDGLPIKNFQGWSLKSSKGEIFMGGPESFNSFFPDKIKYNHNLPPVYITKLKIFNTVVKTQEKINNRVVLKEDIIETKHLTLTYKENFFSLEFVALDYTAPSKNQYAYKMEGVNFDWIFCGAGREASYTNLNPGEYVFRVKASNNDGVWNEEGATLKITILPPWWLTGWFKLIALIFILGLVFLIYYLRFTIYRKQQLTLKKLVKERTRELEQTNQYLYEQQAKVEEQSHELKAYAENLKEANEILIERQGLIQMQAQELKEKNIQLSILNDTRDKIFSIIGHDLRNPFSVISGFADILITRYKKIPADKLEKYFGIIKTSAFVGNNLLENLLNWSRSQLGNITCEPATLDLKHLIEETLMMFSGSAQQKSINVESSLEELFVFADENMINTIFRNLISNAIKFTRDGGRITVSSKEAGHFVEVSITDTGIGIPPETLSNLFQTTKHISTKGTSNETGTGLGLMVCKEFIEKNGGSIRVKSKVDVGSRFILKLPRAESGE